MPVDVDDLAGAIHQQLALALLADESGNPVPPPPDVDTSLRRLADAIAAALVDRLVGAAAVTVSGTVAGQQVELQGTLS